MKAIILALLISTPALTGCITQPTKPDDQPTQATASDVTRSCLEHGRYVMRYFDEDKQEWRYLTFACKPMFVSKQPPKPPEVDEQDYKGPRGLSI
jgi:hypothetical protein